MDPNQPQDPNKNTSYPGYQNQESHQDHQYQSSTTNSQTPYSYDNSHEPEYPSFQHSQSLPYPGEPSVTGTPDISYHSEHSNPFDQESVSFNAPSPSLNHSSPALHHPEPHNLGLPPVASPFNDPDSRRNSFLAPQESYPLYDMNTAGGSEDAYNGDYEEQDTVPLHGTANSPLPYPATNPAPHRPGLLERLGSVRRNHQSQYGNIPYPHTPSTIGEDDGLVYEQGFGDYPGSQIPYPTTNAYFPYPSNDVDGQDPRLEMPFPDIENQSALIEDSWAARQNAQPTTENVVKRQVNLVNGIYSVEYPVPSPVKNAVEEKYRKDNESGSTEFTHMRYTACTCDPDDFVAENYTLRAAENGRKTELLIVVTYYSEDKILTARTLTGIMENVHHFCNDKSQFWRQDNKEPWEKIVVSIIMDGLEPCRKDVLDTLATMGIYQDGVMKKAINEKTTVAHIFEYTSQVCFTEKLDVVTPSKTKSHRTIPPIQYVLCIKQENSKKINSHRWLFNGFGKALNPNICVLIDAGTKPANRAIVHLWRAFYNNANVGGACGEIHAMLGKKFKNLLNPLVAAQNFEYKLSNILDKPLEDTFGFISVLPGAFSAYRYEALQGRPLEQYFRGDHSLADRLGKNGLHGMNIFQRNMFLAEDRILCFEITFKSKKKWHLKYVKASMAETDVPEAIDEFISQRRRWINGSFAATLYSMMHFGQIYHTSHNVLRNFCMHLQLFYNFVNIIMTWFSLAAYYLTTTIILELAADPNSESKDSAKAVSSQKRSIEIYGRALVDSAVSLVARADTSITNVTNTAAPFPFSNIKVSLSIALFVRFFYLLMLIISFLLALGNRPKGARKQYTFMFVVFGIIQIYALIVAFYLCFNAFLHSPDKAVTSLMGSAQLLVIIALVSTYGVYLVSGIIYLDPWHIFTCFAQYSFIMPSFTNVINVYAFCNWHDVSWGTKGSDKAEALPAASSEKTEDGKADVVVEYSRPQDDIDAQFNAVMERARLPYPKEEKTKKKIDTEDENRAFRTNLIITWILCNAILAVAMTSKSITEIGFSGTTSRSSVYFFILIAITAGMAAIRMIGCIIFVVKAAIARGFGKK